MDEELRRYEEGALIKGSPEEVFAFIDDHENLSSHMKSSSMAMGGGKMETQLDDWKGQRVGSHIRMTGSAFGIPLSIDEAVTLYEPPRSKEWETVGAPHLVVIGYYRMGVRILPKGAMSLMHIFIDYDMPRTAFMGKLFGKMYAKWCVKQMMKAVVDRFGTVKV